MYLPVLLLTVLGLLSAAFMLIQSPHAEKVVNTLLATALGGSVVHLQALANACMTMVVVPTLLLCFGKQCISLLLRGVDTWTLAILLSFSPRISYLAPILFLVFILATIGTTSFLLIQPVPLPVSDALRISFPQSNPKRGKEFAPAALRRTKTTTSCRTALWFVLVAQVAYTAAMAFWIAFIFTSSSTSSTFTTLQTTFTAIALLLVLVAYYQAPRYSATPPSENNQHDGGVEATEDAETGVLPIDPSLPPKDPA
ncbi:hypothetical protein H0H87_006203 [Tephrocybe sp. NHM501043]|nr:hypothetical protein H0H87_006203 [Tephrocybe sp. NHM501043]